MALNSPAILPNADLHSGSARGGEGHVVTAKAGELFQLTLDIPDNSNAAHVAELYDAGGRKLWSLPISAALDVVMMLRTPAGKPTSIANSPMRSAVNGVCSAGLRITQLPQANAGPSFHAAISMGKFHGII